MGSPDGAKLSTIAWRVDVRGSNGLVTRSGSCPGPATTRCAAARHRHASCGCGLCIYGHGGRTGAVVLTMVSVRPRQDPRDVRNRRNPRTTRPPGCQDDGIIDPLGTRRPPIGLAAAANAPVPETTLASSACRTSTMGYSVIHVDKVEPAGPGGAVRFVRRVLGVEAFGINWFEIPPNTEGHEHDEARERPGGGQRGRRRVGHVPRRRGGDRRRSRHVPPLRSRYEARADRRAGRDDHDRRRCAARKLRASRAVLASACSSDSSCGTSSSRGRPSTRLRDRSRARSTEPVDLERGNGSLRRARLRG